MDIASLVAVAKSIVDLVTGAANLSRGRAGRVADYFASVAATLAAGAEAVRDSKDAAVQLGKLEVYANSFAEETKPFVGADEANAHQELLVRCLNAKQLASDLYDSAKRAEIATTLFTASGKFSALADTLRLRG